MTEFSLNFWVVLYIYTENYISAKSGLSSVFPLKQLPEELFDFTTPVAFPLFIPVFQSEIPEIS